MKRITIYFLFIFTFLHGYSQDEVNLEKGIIELEKRVETQERIIESYEKLEERINSRVEQSLKLDLEVKEAYKEKFLEIKDEYRTRMSYIWKLIISLGIFVTLITAIPIFDRTVLLNKLNKQEEKLQKQQEKIEKDLEEHEEFDKKLNKALAEVYNLNASKEANIIKNSSPNNFKPHSEGLVKNVMQSIECLMKIPDEMPNIKCINLVNATFKGVAKWQNRVIRRRSY